MIRFVNSAKARFRAVAFLEGISFLLLLFIAMPLKYWAGMPLLVKWVGWAHGLLFVMYVFTLVEVSLKLGWSFITSLLAFVASLLPFGTFLMDARLFRKPAGTP